MQPRISISSDKPRDGRKLQLSAMKLEYASQQRGFFTPGDQQWQAPLTLAASFMK